MADTAQDDDARKAAPLSPALAPEARVAGRYHIVRFLARGGMGEVYEADDLALRDRIALKVLRVSDESDGSSESRALERFKREVQLARKVTHPNVCRIFDLGVDGDGDGRIVFLTMELLPGESLAERLARGRMAAAEALPLVAQMAEALAAAHAAGVIHRDFKSSNVMLVPAAGGVRVVVTDFGLARPSERQGDAMLSLENALIGSPKYMAPEQVEGVALTPACDVYALGVVAYEMVAGRVPFLGDTPLATALKRLTEAPPPPQTFAPEVPAGWTAVLQRCLARDPATRFADPRAFVTALRDALATSSATAAPTTPTSTPRPRTRAIAVAAGVALAVAGAVGGLGWHARHRAAAPQPSTATATATATAELAGAPHVRRAIAVVGLRNLDGRREDAWLATAFGEMLTSELAAGEQLRAVSGEVVARMKRDLALDDAERYAPETLARIRRQLDVDWVVAGSYDRTAAGELRLEVALQDARSGETIERFDAHAPAAQLNDLVAQAGVKLRAALGVESVGAERLARASFPADAEAARLYAEAFVVRRASDTIAAEKLLEEAVARDPSFALGHSALGDVYLDLGYTDKARAEAERAFKLADALPREQRLLLEARYHKTREEWGKAADIYRALFTFFPDDLSYGLWLARAQVFAGRSAEALQTVAEMRKLPAPLSDDPWIDMREAQAWAKQGNWKKRLEASERGMQKGRALGARLLVADAQMGAAESLYFLGDVPRAQQYYEEAKAAYDAVGDQKGSVGASVGLADILMARGDVAGARREYERALAFHRANGSEYGQADMLNAVGQAYQAEGKLDQALATWKESLAHFTAINEREGIGNVTSNSADVLLAEGQPAEAERRYRAALERFRDVGMKTHEAACLGDIAGTLRRQGKLAESRALDADAIARLRAIGDSQKLMDRLAEEALRLREEDDLSGANKALAEARAIARERGLDEDARRVRALSVQAAVDTGKARDVVTEARALVAEADRGGRADDEAEARELLARVLLATGAGAEAAATIDRAAALAASSEARALVWQIRITGARAHAAACQPALADVVAAATRGGAVDARLEAELAAAEVARGCGEPGATAVLARVADEARRLGFTRIARLAK